MKHFGQMNETGDTKDYTIIFIFISVFHDVQQRSLSKLAEGERRKHRKN